MSEEAQQEGSVSDHGVLALSSRVREIQERLRFQPRGDCERCGVSHYAASLREGVCPDCLATENELRYAVERLGIPTRFADLQIESQPLQEWLERVKAGTETEGVLLWGPTGTHKTGNAFAALRSATEAGLRPTWEALPNLIRGCSLNEQRERVNQLAQPRLVFLDDLGAHTDSAWVEQELCRLLDTRFAWCRPTIVTSNLSPKQIRAVFGDRIASRMGGWAEIRFSGADSRAKRP